VTRWAVRALAVLAAVFAAVAIAGVAVWRVAAPRDWPPVALCPAYDSVVVRHRMKSTGWPDSTLHTHVYRAEPCQGSGATTASPP
jgi:hypothetical protein